MTGMRIGEASALHWSDIDFETGLKQACLALPKHYITEQ